MVDDRQRRCLDIAILLPLSVVQVVGMHDTHHVVELVRPSAPVVVPVQMLWLLQNSDIRLKTPRPEFRIGSFGLMGPDKGWI